VRPVISLDSPALNEAKVMRAGNIGAVAAVGLGIAMGFALEKYKEWLRDELANAPPPQIDSRETVEYLKHPGQSITLLDAMSKDIASLGPRLDEARSSMLGEAATAVLLVGAGKRTPEERVQLLGQIYDGVSRLQSDLQQVRDGVGGVLELQGEAAERAKAANDLADMVMDSKERVGPGQVLVWDFLVKQGFGIEEILAMVANLRSYARRITAVMRDYRALQQHVESVLAEVSAFASKVNGLYWAEALAPLKKQQ